MTRMADYFHQLDPARLQVEQLGEALFDSPVSGRPPVSEDQRVSYWTQTGDLSSALASGEPLPSFEMAGPRQKLFHDPARTRAAVVTCGGLCPGLNDVIKGIVHVLNYDYGVRDVLGIPFGYRGLNPDYGHTAIPLTVESVDHIHELGGTVLGSSRGQQDCGVMVDTLERLEVNLLFTIGGDGTLRGASAIVDEIERRQLPISVIGVPKTIDNDLLCIERSFGFETAVYSTFDVLTEAHVEARASFNGVSVIKLMGRDSGFIAAAATLSNSVVNFCLIPESPFALEGEHGLLKALERRFQESHHAVIVVAEGAGQDLFKDAPERRDASGNILKNDIGDLLCERISEHFKSLKTDVTVRYFDPSYSIRSGPARGTDAVYCHLLADSAVHAAMAGRTRMIVGRWHNLYTHVPIAQVTRERRKIDPENPIWKSILSLTRQESYFHPRIPAKNTKE